VKWLTTGGIVAAAGVGVAVTGGLGLGGLGLLATFFLTGSLLTQISGGAGGQRTARQVVANGGAAAAAALFGSWAGAAGSLAAATADTWATEIGSFARTPPRLLTTAEPVPRGASGGVTTLGTSGGVAGAALIGALTAALGPAGWRGAAITAAVGVLGMLFDSLLGATAQSRGWLDNDGVNFASTCLGCGLGIVGSVGW
jgi:uncharacterized protein (TIGR00297 family)